MHNTARLSPIDVIINPKSFYIKYRVYVKILTLYTLSQNVEIYKVTHYHDGRLAHVVVRTVYMLPTHFVSITFGTYTILVNSKIRAFEFDCAHGIFR